MNSDSSTIPEVAFYYPNPIWASSDWVKNLILFFDGVALLVPEYMTDRPQLLEPAIVTGLEEHSLLRILQPEKLIDAEAAQKLAAAMRQFISSGSLDALNKNKSAFAQLSYSRMGSYGDEQLAKNLLTELKKRGLAKDSEDGVSIPMNPMVRALILTLLAQILRPKGLEIGIDLAPATDRPNFIAALQDVLQLSNTPSRADVVSFDLDVIGTDIGSFPIDEVLEYRRENYDAYRAYAKSIRSFTLELSALEPEERTDRFAERQEEISDLAAGLRRRSRQAWKKPAGMALTAAGAAWAVHTGDLLGLALSGVGVAIGGPEAPPEASAYSYLFNLPSARWG